MTDNLYDENNGGGECKWDDFLGEKTHWGLIDLVAHQTTPLSSVEKPPLSKNETNLSGLQNQGATW